MSDGNIARGTTGQVLKKVSDADFDYAWEDEAGGPGGVAWGAVTGTLSDQADLQTALDSKSASNHNHDGTYAAVSHSHAIGDVTSLQTSLDAKAASTVVTDHVALADPHTQYQKESEKGAANGYASLSASTKIPIAEIPTGTSSTTVSLGDHTHAQLHNRQHSITDTSDHTFPGGSTFLRADGVFAAPPGGSEAFPVGSVFIAVVSTNPGTLLGYGTWSAFAAGRVLVGLDSGQTEFDTVEETGGAKTHTLQTTEVPAHNHQTLRERSATTGGATTLIARTSDTSSTVDTNVFTENTGGGQAHNNLQPYIVVYMWKRTA